MPLLAVVEVSDTGFVFSVLLICPLCCVDVYSSRVCTVRGVLLLVLLLVIGFWVGPLFLAGTFLASFILVVVDRDSSGHIGVEY